MNPEDKQSTFKANKVLVRPVGSAEDAPWQELGAVTELKLTGPKPSPIDPEELRAIKFPRTVTYTFKMTKLEYRAFMRIFGVKVPSLIHNGKKRKK